MESNQPSPPTRKPERTIEDLLEYTNEQLAAMSATELESWMGDALTAQEEILRNVPHKAAKQPGVQLRKPMDAAAARRARDTAALLPDDMQKTLADAQALLNRIKGL